MIVHMQNTYDILLQQATLNDLDEIRTFTDFWLSGRGKRVNAPGAVDDCFISPSQHKRYIEKYITFKIIIEKKMVGWGVIQHDGSLIHFLIAGTHRGQGIGSSILNLIAPQKIRSKSDQSSGNPGPFYERLGYKKIMTVKSRSKLNIDKIRPDRKPNIDIYEKIA